MMRARELAGVLVLAEPGAADRAREAARAATEQVGQQANEMIDGAAAVPRVEVMEAAWMRPERARSVRASRVFARSCWRGGLGSLTPADELLDPVRLAPILASRGIEAVCVVGEGWVAVDPGLIDACVRRHRRDPEGCPIVFAHAPAGVCGYVVGGEVVAELAEHEGPFSSVGGLLGYIPTAPRLDPIGKGVCVEVGPTVRDAGERLIADHPRGVALLEGAAAVLGEEGFARADVGEILRAGVGAVADDAEAWVEEIELEAPTEPAIARAAGLVRGGAGGRAIGVSVLIDESASPGLSDGAWLRGVVGRLRPAVVHVRACPRDRAEAENLRGCGADVISVDLRAFDAGTFERLTGRADFESRRDALAWMIQERDGPAAGHVVGHGGGGGLPVPWIVPRIERCDAVVEEIEPFYTTWLLRAGACVIDPPRGAGDRLVALARPTDAGARRRIARIDGSGAVWWRTEPTSSRVATEPVEPIEPKIGSVVALGAPDAARADAARADAAQKGAAA